MRQCSLLVALLAGAVLASGCSSNFLGDFNRPSRQEPACVIVAGDSWGLLDYLYGATEGALKTKQVQVNGQPCHAEYIQNTVTDSAAEAMELPLVIPGSRAEQWYRAPHYTWIANAAIEHRSASVIFLYIGGNDIVLPYTKGAIQIPTIVDHIAATIEGVQKLLDAGGRQRVPFVVVGYTRSNFLEATGDAKYLPLKPPDPNEANKAHQKQVNQQFSDLADGLLQRFKDKPELRAWYLDNRCLHIDPCPGDMEEPLNRKYLANIKLLGFYYLFANASHLGAKTATEVAERAVCLALQRGTLQGTPCL